MLGAGGLRKGCSQEEHPVSQMRETEAWVQDSVLVVLEKKGSVYRTSGQGPSPCPDSLVGFSWGRFCPSRGHVAGFGDIFGCHPWGRGWLWVPGGRIQGCSSYFTGNSHSQEFGRLLCPQGCGGAGRRAGRPGGRGELALLPGLRRPAAHTLLPRREPPRLLSGVLPGVHRTGPGVVHPGQPSGVISGRSL